MHVPGFLRLAAMMLLLTGLSPALAQLSPDFMPKGGRTLFVEVFGETPDEEALIEMAAGGLSEADWAEMLKARETGLGDKEMRTLASYLALNMPLSSEAVAAAKAGLIAEELPADGRELAWNKCQSCHSLFAGYLTQDRDLQGWRNMFLSPFHRELKMTDREREEFSHYSVINMPMKFEDVPEDLRF
ncbi:MAG: hypothetical protein Q8P46_07845 [Hyphomicrobiales bacterium]|nr:hypothetical protein [Hyphomicrobiales bacterium]